MKAPGSAPEKPAHWKMVAKTPVTPAAGLHATSAVKQAVLHDIKHAGNEEHGAGQRKTSSGEYSQHILRLRHRLEKVRSLEDSFRDGRDWHSAVLSLPCSR